MGKSSEQPRWQRNAIFEFFASLKLAVVLLAVLIVAAIAGTIWESSFDAKVARAYVYGAPWFNFWLVLLALNLAASALSRWPWKKYHTAFLITHLGIITLLAGSLIGRIFGIEGTITLFKGEPPSNRLLLNERQLRVHDLDGIIKGYPAEFLHHPPSPKRPRDFGPLASGAHLWVVDYAPAIEAKLNPKAAANGAPAVHFSISTAMMNQHLENWLIADDPEHSKFSMGLANIELKRGAASSVVAAAVPGGRPQEIDLEESIFAFSKSPDEQIGHVRKGGSIGAKVRLLPPENGNKGRVLISLGEKQTAFDVAENSGRAVKIDNSPFTLKIEEYWPDFRIENGKPRSISDQPNNPAVLVTISGKSAPAPAPPTTSAHASENLTGLTGQVLNGPVSEEGSGGASSAPAMPPAGADIANHLTLFVADDGAVTYELVSRKAGQSSGKIDINIPLATGWADWQLKIDKVLLHAEPQTDFIPLNAANTANNPPAGDLPEGVRVRLEQNGRSIEQWIPAGWQVAVPTSPNPTMLSYGWRLVSLPIGLELLDFEVKRNEGSDTPASFKSTLRVSASDGTTATGSCWMNHPFSFPGRAFNTWTGLTYKMSQASWNPENLDQSTVQILRDPGWLLKWIGSLLVVLGVFMMFYLQPYRKQTEGEPILPMPRADLRKRERLVATQL